MHQPMRTRRALEPYLQNHTKEISFIETFQPFRQRPTDLLNHIIGVVILKFRGKFQANFRATPSRLIALFPEAFSRAPRCANAWPLPFSAACQGVCAKPLVRTRPSCHILGYSLFKEIRNTHACARLVNSPIPLSGGEKTPRFGDHIYMYSDASCGTNILHSSPKYRSLCIMSRCLYRSNC